MSTLGHKYSKLWAHSLPTPSYSGVVILPRGLKRHPQRPPLGFEKCTFPRLSTKFSNSSSSTTLWQGVGFTRPLQYVHEGLYNVFQGFPRKVSGGSAQRISVSLRNAYSKGHQRTRHEAPGQLSGGQTSNFRCVCGHFQSWFRHTWER